MDYSEKYVEELPNDCRIENKIRGNLSYYTLNQVADLLKEDVNKIKYYTNIFDDILKIDILNKELRYTEKDINKLELLINLKDKGMSLKEVQEYYDKLPVINEEESNFENTNLISVSDLVNLLIDAQKEQFNIQKANLLNEISEANTKYINTITNELIETQKRSFTELKYNLTKEIEKSLADNLANYQNDFSSLQNNLINDVTNIITEKIEVKNNELEKSLDNNLKQFAEDSLDTNTQLIKEVRDFKRVLKDAYYTHNEIEREQSSFFGKLLKRINK